MLLLRPPTVYAPQGDTWLLADALRAEVLEGKTRVLDLCTGSGALAVAAARLGALQVTAVDVSHRAVITTWLNTRFRGLKVRVRVGDLASSVSDERFDVILSNPPYVPAAGDELPARGLARCWDAGVDGRAVLDRICVEAPPLLAPGGVLLLVFSTVCGEDHILQLLRAGGLDATVAARTSQPFGPVMSARARMLEARGLIDPGQRFEDLVVVRGQAPV